jgi:Mn2+/Fe2+ NRAMP family transporter
MLAVPVLAGSATYAIAEAEKWRGNLESRPILAKRFYAVVAVSMLLGLALDFVGFNAVKMLFYSAVLNGAPAPPLIVLVTLLTSNPKVMGTRVVSPLLRYLGWGTAAIMSIAAIGMFLTQ